jgi:type II restriction/modification system DNA methylase subunit YeeA
MDTNTLKANLDEFKRWKESYCKGYEKGEAQNFLIKFFQCFGYEGVLEAGGKFEEPQKRGSVKGGTGFKDCIFKDIVLIEMKKGGSDLTHHYNQLLTYWVQCTPKPKYAVLCNFDEFWIYDFNVQVDTPVQKIKTTELAEHPEALLFMIGQRARFNLNVVEITETVTEQISELFKRLKTRQKSLGISEDQARRFVLQCVLCLFAEDIDLLPNGFFGEILHECKANPKKSYDLLRGLFEQMNNREPARGGMYKDVRYFNGGLFNEIIPIQLAESDIDILITASSQNWTAVRPSIFGTVLEATMSDEDRHAHGVHYTSEVDIYKIVRPTIVRYWDERIEEAGTTQKKLRRLLNQLRNYKILDPACGSGNFLYIAYQEMKRIEKEIIEKLAEISVKENENQQRITYVTPYQFYGIDIKPFAVELTKLVLEIGRTIAIKKLKLNQEDPLPLDNLDKNIICADALFTEWPEANAIIGNPPFLGSRKMRDSGIEEEYIQKIHGLYPSSEFPKNADFCTYWFRKAHEQKAERIGLVGSNSITQNESRKASLGFIVSNGGIIHDAIPTQEWSGEAAVHVSIVNWAREEQKQKYLDVNPVSFINSSLKTEIDVSNAHRLKQSESMCFQGVVPVGKFEITEKQALEWIEKDSKNKKVLKVFFSGNEITEYPDYKSDKWIVDFNNLSLEEASIYKLPFEHVKIHVKPQREKVRRKSHLEKWWQYGDKRPAMRESIKNLEKYISMPGHSKNLSENKI